MDDLSNLFNQASVVGEENDIEWFVIDHMFRTITIPTDKRLVGVTSDEKVNTLYFKCPRYYEDVDLNEFTFRINYMNAGGEGDVYLVTDKTATEDEITFSWLVGRHACEYAGQIRFIICAIDAGSSDVIEREYNTAIHYLTVVQGLETSEAVERYAYDVIDQIIDDAGERALEDLVIDTTLSISGAAADAKTVGDTLAGLAPVQPTETITLSTSWTSSLYLVSRWSQVITLSNYTVTANTRVNIGADVNTLATMANMMTSAIVVENDNGVLTAYAYGEKPTVQLTIQVYPEEIHA